MFIGCGGKSLDKKTYLDVGSKLFKVYQNLVTTSLFLSFLPNLFLPCKNTFMDDYDGI
jgi:hypothetical protein